MLRVLVERMLCCDCVKWTLMVVSLDGQYLEALEAGPGGVFSGFDVDEPGGLDRKAGGGVEVVDKGADAGGVLGVEGIRGRRVCRNEVGWMGVWIVFWAQRELP